MAQLCHPKRISTLVLLSFLVATALAGCADDAEPDPQAGAPAAPEAVGGPGTMGNQSIRAPLAAPEVLLDSTFLWHVDPADPAGASPMGLLTLPIHPVFPDCITSAGEPYLTNLEIGGAAAIPPGAGAVKVTLAWPDAVSTFNELVVAYQPPGGEWIESPYLAEGEAHVIPLDSSVQDDGDRRTGWNWFACVTRDPDNYPGTTFRTGVFSGRLHVVIEALP